MNCFQLSEQLGFRCKQVSETVLYVESPITLGWDGDYIGAYIQQLDNDRVRLSDNADILFSAMTHGIQPSSNLTKRLRAIASSHDIELTEGGELSAVCSNEEAGFHLLRFIEAADDISRVCGAARPIPTTSFESDLALVLGNAFGSRITRSAKVIGASGHELSFPFALDFEKNHPRLIQPIGTMKGKANWRSIYNVAGKMMDVKAAAHPAKRIVILEPSGSKETNQAVNVLAVCANVIIYESSTKLVQALAA